MPEKHSMRKVIKAPKWLVERMENLKNSPPPTIEEVDIQMKASAMKSKKKKQFEGLFILCFNCDKQITDFGALLLSPPRAQYHPGASVFPVDKIHLCVECYWKVVKYLSAD